MFVLNELNRYSIMSIAIVNLSHSKFDILLVLGMIEGMRYVRCHPGGALGRLRESERKKDG